MNNSRNKILFLGDSFIGKTSLVNTLCGINAQPQSTLGCSIQISPHQYLAGTPHETTELLEFWDVGGSNAHREASSVFMAGADGVVLVHDLNNVRSEQNLALWLDLLYTQTSRHRRHTLNSSRANLSMSDTSSILSEKSLDASGAGDRFIALDMDRVYTIPMLIVGTGLDQCNNLKRTREHSPLLRAHDHVALNARKPIAPGSTNRLLFSNFFDKVVQQCAAREGGTASSPTLTDGVGNPRHRTAAASSTKINF